MRRRWAESWIAGLIFSAAVAWAGNAIAAERIAFVIGVNQYDESHESAAPGATKGAADDSPRLQSLYAAVDDAKAVAARLKELNFKVELLIDADRKEVEEKLKRFVDAHAGLAGAAGERTGIAFFYFAGHGVEYLGDAGAKGNYLLVRDSKAMQVPQTGIALSEVVNQLDQLKRHHAVLVLDTCRDTKLRALYGLPSLLRQDVRPVMRPANLVPRGSSLLIQYATAFDERTPDVGRRGHAPYTGELLQHLGTPGLSLDEVFSLTKKAVMNGYGISPFMEGGLAGVVVLRSAPWWQGPPLLSALALLGLGSTLIALVRRRRRLEMLTAWVVDAATGKVRGELLPGAALLIGRGPEAQIRVDLPAISGRHARLSFDGVSLWIQDLGSTGGTWVDGAWTPGAPDRSEPQAPKRLEPSERRPLRDGESLWLSERTIQLRVRIGVAREMLAAVRASG